jgi:hypothetical protein
MSDPVYNEYLVPQVWYEQPAAPDGSVPELYETMDDNDEAEHIYGIGNDAGTLEMLEGAGSESNMYDLAGNNVYEGDEMTEGSDNLYDAGCNDGYLYDVATVPSEDNDGYYEMACT